MPNNTKTTWTSRYRFLGGELLNNKSHVGVAHTTLSEVADLAKKLETVNAVRQGNPNNLHAYTVIKACEEAIRASLQPAKTASQTQTPDAPGNETNPSQFRTP